MVEPSESQAPEETGHGRMEAPITPPDVASRFDRLVAQWRRETALASSMTARTMNMAYQQIIGIGPAAVPLILQELQRRPDHWSWALMAISGEDPIPPEARGRLRDVALAWLKWGRERGHV